MAWYDDKNRTTYVVTYEDEKSMAKELEAAAKQGWTVEGTPATEATYNVGRTATATLLTGGLRLLAGTSRSKDKLTITYVRDEKLTARQVAAEATKRLADQEDRYDKALQHLEKSELAYEA